jgi:hypothetical protein
MSACDACDGWPVCDVRPLAVGGGWVGTTFDAFYEPRSAAGALPPAALGAAAGSSGAALRCMGGMPGSWVAAAMAGRCARAVARGPRLAGGLPAHS